jgi:hypothetical protein
MFDLELLNGLSVNYKSKTDHLFRICKQESLTKTVAFFTLYGVKKATFFVVFVGIFFCIWCCPIFQGCEAEMADIRLL